MHKYRTHVGVDGVDGGHQAPLSPPPPLTTPPPFPLPGSQVFTSDIRGAGTDANVTIIMFGTNGIDTGKIKLDSNKNDFERGQVCRGQRGRINEGTFVSVVVGRRGLHVAGVKIRKQVGACTGT